MSVLRKLCVFALSLAALYLAALSLAAFAAGVTSATGAHLPGGILQARLSGEANFSLQYRPVLLAGMIPLALAAAFGWGIGGMALAVPAAAAGFWLMLQVPPDFPRLDTPEAAAARLQRATARAQHTAIAKYPDLGRVGSPLNREFRERYRNYQRLNPEYLDDPFWPMRLAQESKRAVGATPPRFPLP
jgi:hypothetical protein